MLPNLVRHISQILSFPWTVKNEMSQNNWIPMEFSFDMNQVHIIYIIQFSN